MPILKEGLRDILFQKDCSFVHYSGGQQIGSSTETGPQRRSSVGHHVSLTLHNLVSSEGT